MSLVLGKDWVGGEHGELLLAHSGIEATGMYEVTKAQRDPHNIQNTTQLLQTKWAGREGF